MDEEPTELTPENLAHEFKKLGAIFERMSLANRAFVFGLPELRTVYEETKRLVRLMDLDEEPGTEKE